MTDIRDVEALARQIEALDIEISHNSEGNYTVCSNSEPLFCYDASSIDEVKVLVSDTIVSYVKLFHNIDVDHVTTIDEPLEEELLPIERSTPIQRLKPVFDLAA